MLQCIIVDDEPLAQEILESYILRISGLQLLKKCSNALEAFEVLHKEKIDLIFLDVQLPVIDGLAFLKSLSHPPLIILTTAFPQHAVESYNLNVSDYLLKPISFERFLKAVNKVAEYVKVRSQEGVINDSTYFFVKVDNKLVSINYDEILFIEGMKDYLKIFLKDKMFVVHQTMKKLEESLPKNHFIRIHKSYIVSLNKVKSIVGNYIEIGDKEIPIGANYKDDLIQKIVKGSKL